MFCEVASPAGTTCGVLVFVCVCVYVCVCVFSLHVCSDLVLPPGGLKIATEQKQTNKKAADHIKIRLSRSRTNIHIFYSIPKPTGRRSHPDVLLLSVFFFKEAQNKSSLLIRDLMFSITTRAFFLLKIVFLKNDACVAVFLVVYQLYPRVTRKETIKNS